MYVSYVNDWLIDWCFISVIMYIMVVSLLVNKTGLPHRKLCIKYNKNRHTDIIFGPWRITWTSYIILYEDWWNHWYIFKIKTIAVIQYLYNIFYLKSFCSYVTRHCMICKSKSMLFKIINTLVKELKDWHCDNMEVRQNQW